MNELQRPLEVIETEISFYQNQTAIGIIEIGKRLIEAKKQLPHGEWGNWLKEKIQFSQEYARHYMIIAEEFGDSNSGLNLGYKKMWLLTDIPQEERQDFIDSNDVEAITTRELERVIKAKKQADLKIEELEEKLLQEPKEIEVIKEVVKEAEVPPADYLTTKAERDKLKGELEIAELEKKQLKNRLQEETNPELLQQMTKRESEARVEASKLRKQLEAIEADSKTIETKVKKSSITFCGKVHNFLTDVGGLAWINDYSDLLDGQEKKDYLTALNALEGWLYAIKNTIKGEQ